MSQSTRQKGKAFVVEAFEMLFNKKHFVAAEKLRSSNVSSRRGFITQASYFGALYYALARTMPLPALAQTAGIDSRVSATPLVDKGFASVRKIGNGLYATISDPSKGVTTECNGGFLVGKDAALLIEGFFTPAGASFQMEALRSVSQVPVKAALDTHYHFDHTHHGQRLLRRERRASLRACLRSTTNCRKLRAAAGRRQSCGARAF
jgi:metallo-beta-lactamase superfamily protein